MPTIPTFPPMRATVTTLSSGADVGDAPSILIDGADTPITANGTPGYQPTPGDRLLVQQVGGTIEVVQFLATGAIPRITAYRQDTLPDPTLTPLYSVCYLTDAGGNVAGQYRLEQVAGVNTWVLMAHNASALNIPDVRKSTVESGFTMGGGGAGNLSNGPTSPTAAPVISTYNPTLNSYKYLNGADVSDLFSGLIQNPSDNTKWLTASWDGDLHGHIHSFTKSTGGSPVALDAAQPWGLDFQPWGGICAAGTYLYVMGWDWGRAGDTYIYKINSTTYAKTDELRLGPQFYFSGGLNTAQLFGESVFGGQNLGYVWMTSNGNLKVRWYDTNLNQIGSDINLGAIGGGQQMIGGVLWGDAGSGLGSSTLWVTMQTYGNMSTVDCWKNVTTSAATRAITSDFPKVKNKKYHALGYDTVAGHIHGMDIYGTIYTHSQIGQVDNSSLSVSARYTFYDGDTGNYAGAIGSGTTIINGVDVSGTASTAHETGYSPTATLLVGRRQFVRITLPVLPIDVVKPDASDLFPDKANRSGIYIAIGGGTMWRALYTPAATPASAPVLTNAQSIYDGFDTFPSSGTPDVHTFATAQASLGIFQSVATRASGLPKFYVDGSGAMTADGLIPPGTIIAFAGTVATPPPGWLACRGGAFSRTGFSDLFAVIGTTYGLGDGSTTFNVPDLRGRIPYGVYGAGGVAKVEGAYEGQINGSTTPPGVPDETRFDHQHVHGPGATVNLATNTTTGGTANRVSNLPAAWTDSQGVGAGANRSYHCYLGINWIIKT